jgi:hypothetical protein
MTKNTVSAAGGAMPEIESALYLPTDVTPEEVFQAIGRLRKEARDEIDRLIRFLDETDNHMEREPDDDEPVEDEEPSLGSFDCMTDQSKSWAGRKCDPITGEDFAVDAENDNSDDEPSLGSVAVGESRSQEGWTDGSNSDLEDGHDGAEPDEDGEPSLGAFEGHNNHDVAWAATEHFPDMELDGAESGIGDQDGMDEQVPFRDWQGVGMV